MDKKGKKFVGFFLDKKLSEKLDFLKEELGQSLSSLIREGLNMLFSRYSKQLDERGKE